MEDKKIEGTTCPKSCLKQVLQQIWQTIVVFFIMVCACLGACVAFNLQYVINDASPKTAIFILLAYPVFMYVISDTIWGGCFKKVRDNFWSKGLAYSAFILFVLCGLLAFGFFIYYGYVFWWADILSWRIVPLLFGTALFLTFIYKVIFGLGD